MSESLISIQDNLRLETNLQLRERIIKSCMPNGQVPTCPETLDVMFRAMEGMDKTILSKAKIKSEDANQNNQQALVKQMAELLTMTSGSQNRPRSQRHKKIELPDSVVVTNPVAGEKEGNKNLTYNEFIKESAE